MTQNGYVYLMSNVALKRGIYKIGLTQQHPKDRAKSLSASTSIPTDFIVEYFKETKKFETSEKRIHLLLDEYRYASNKEFFQINKKFAKDIIDEIVQNTELNYIHSDEFAKHNDLIMAAYSKKMTSNAYKVLMLLMCSSQNDTPMHKLFGITDNYIISGFINYSSIMLSFNVSKIQSMQILKEFAKKYSDLTYKLPYEDEHTSVFEFVKYYKGELGWKFSIEYRKLFYNYAKPNFV